MNGAAWDVMRPAGFWVRLVAFAIDLIVIALAQLLLRTIAVARFGGDGERAMGPVGFFTFVFAVAYPTVLHAIAGQTLGKLLMRVRVVALDGGALPLGAALLRAVAFWVTLFVLLGIGHIVGGLRKDKRAFHDVIAGSRTERVPPRARVPEPSRPAQSMPAEDAFPAPPRTAEGGFPAPPTESEPRSTG